MIRCGWTPHVPFGYAVPRTARLVLHFFLPRFAVPWFCGYVACTVTRWLWLLPFGCTHFKLTLPAVYPSCYTAHARSPRCCRFPCPFTAFVLVYVTTRYYTPHTVHGSFAVYVCGYARYIWFRLGYAPHTYRMLPVTPVVTFYTHVRLPAPRYSSLPACGWFCGYLPDTFYAGCTGYALPFTRWLLRLQVAFTVTTVCASLFAVATRL